jgi:hypothetical protein
MATLFSNADRLGQFDRNPNVAPRPAPACRHSYPLRPHHTAGLPFLPRKGWDPIKVIGLGCFGYLNRPGPLRVANMGLNPALQPTIGRPIIRIGRPIPGCGPTRDVTSYIHVCRYLGTPFNPKGPKEGKMGTSLYRTPKV